MTKHIDDGNCPWCEAHLLFFHYGRQSCPECGNKITVNPERGSNDFAALEAATLSGYIKELVDFIGEISGSVSADLIRGTEKEIGRLAAKRDLLLSFK